MSSAKWRNHSPKDDDFGSLSSLLLSHQNETSQRFKIHQGKRAPNLDLMMATQTGCYWHGEECLGDYQTVLYCHQLGALIYKRSLYLFCTIVLSVLNSKNTRAARVQAIFIRFLLPALWLIGTSSPGRDKMKEKKEKFSFYNIIGLWNESRVCVFSLKGWMSLILMPLIAKSECNACAFFPLVPARPTSSSSSRVSLLTSSPSSIDVASASIPSRPSIFLM